MNKKLNYNYLFILIIFYKTIKETFIIRKLKIKVIQGSNPWPVVKLDLDRVDLTESARFHCFPPQKVKLEWTRRYKTRPSRTESTDSSLVHNRVERPFQNITIPGERSTLRL